MTVLLPHGRNSVPGGIKTTCQNDHGHAVVTPALSPEEFAEAVNVPRTGLGRRLAEEVIRQARSLGYATVRLDTVPSVMGAAVRMYRALGFRDIPAYCANPGPGALFLELRLGEEDGLAGGDRDS